MDSLLAVFTMFALKLGVFSQHEWVGPSIDDTICSQPWPCAEALTVVYGPTPVCPNGESGGDPHELGDDGLAIGLLQIRVDVHHDRVEKIVGRALTREEAIFYLQIAAINVAVGYDLYSEVEWTHWSCHP